MKTIRILSSKSVAHRAMIANGLSDRPGRIEIYGTSADMEATASCMKELRRVLKGGETPAKLHCRESGSTYRFLLPVSGALGIRSLFFPEGRLPERPLSPLYEELLRHGMKLSPAGTVPLEASGALTGGEYVIPGNVSSQFITGLLLALPLLRENSTIRVPNRLESAEYVEITRKVIGDFGIRVEGRKEGEATIFEIEGGQRYRAPETYTVEGDWSNAAFWLAAGLIGPEPVEVTGLSRESAQGDRRVVALLRQFGGRIEETPQGVIAYPSLETLSGIEIDAAQIPDLVPVLALVGAFSRGETDILEAGRLRIKESDRLESIREALSALGADVTEGPSELHIRGGTGLTGGTVSSHNDHRIAMMAAIAALGTRGTVRIQGSGAVTKSYPDFYERLEQFETANIERG